MRFEDDPNWEVASKIRKATGRKMKACLFCAKLARGNLQEGIRRCRREATTEGGR